jgi:hypothetical protein
MHGANRNQTEDDQPPRFLSIAHLEIHSLAPPVVVFFRPEVTPLSGGRVNEIVIFRNAEGSCEMEVFKRGTGILPVKNVPFPTKCRKESRARCPCHAISQLPQ